MTSDMDQMSGHGGRGEDSGAATGDSTNEVPGAAAGRATNRTDFASGITDDGLVPGWQPDDGPPVVAERDADEGDIRGDDDPGVPDDALSRVHLDDLGEDGGTPIAGPQDRTDIGNLRGGQHDAATGGSDLGPTTGGGDTGAV